MKNQNKTHRFNLRNTFIFANTLSSIGYLDISTILSMLFSIGYVTLLIMEGHFNDWQELVIEPYFMLRGLKNYTDIVTHHAPLLTEFLAIIYRFFGTDIIVRKIILLIVSTITALLTFRAACRLGDKRTGVYSILLFAFFWPFYGGTHFWFDSFLPMFYLFALVLVIETNSAKWFVVAGISMGISFLIKQTAGAVAFFIFIMLLVRQKGLIRRLQESVSFSAGVVVPILLMALYYAFRGQLADAYFWIWEYNASGIYLKLGKARPPIIQIIRLAVIGTPIIIFLIRALFSKTTRQIISWEYLLVLGMGFCASFTIFPRWERFHVAPSIPFLVICLILSIKLFLASFNAPACIRIKKVAKIVLTTWILTVFLDIGTLYPPMLLNKIVPNFTQYWPLRSYEPPVWVDDKFIRYLEDVPVIGNYLKNATNEYEKIFVFGWMGSNIYYQSDRLPAGRFYYHLPWFTSLPQFKKDLLIGFERDRPRYVIVLKKRFHGTPSLMDLGIHLNQIGYQREIGLEMKFPEVEVWKLDDR